MDGGEAVETVAFGLDGRFYEIDLSAANASRLRDGIADYRAAQHMGKEILGEVSAKAIKRKKRK